MKISLSIFRRRAKKTAAPRYRRASLESLEERDLLSVTAGGEAVGSAALCAPADADTAPVSLPRPTEAAQLAAPVFSSVAGGGGMTHLVVWNAVANASNYQLSYSSDGETWQTLTTSGTSAKITDLVGGNQMRYRVRALNNGSYTTSAWSATRSLYVCPVDVDGDGFIGPGDNSLLSQAWFSNEMTENWNPACDIDGDGFVGPGELSFVSQTWV